MSVKCKNCSQKAASIDPISMAFQPIVDTATKTVFGYEALVRGVNGEGAGTVLSRIDDENRYAFDQQCRVKAIELAAALIPSGPKLSINFMPNAVYEPRACIRLTLETAERVGFSPERIIFEFTENERLDTQHLLNILSVYKTIGFKTAIDDFGAGYAGLDLLAQFQPDIVKLDMNLIRGIGTDRIRRMVVKHTVHMLNDLGITPLCEGVETPEELTVLKDFGVTLMQGYLFAPPAFEALPVPASIEAFVNAA